MNPLQITVTYIYTVFLFFVFCFLWGEGRGVCVRPVYYIVCTDMYVHTEVVWDAMR